MENKLIMINLEVEQLKIVNSEYYKIVIPHEHIDIEKL